MKSKQKKLIPISFLLPSWLLLLIFFVGPVLLTFYFSFTNMSLTGAAAQNFSFIGLDNFRSMFSDPTFTKSIYNTLIFLLFSAVIGQQILGFFIALLLREKNRTFRRIIGVVILAAWVTPEVVVGFIWFAFLSPDGTLNTILSWLHLDSVAWLIKYPMTSLIIANIWKGTAFSMMIFQSSLDNVPRDIEEAAQIDGATPFQLLRRITIPMMRNTIVTNSILVTLQTLGVFTLIYTLTGGGPGKATNTLPIFMYNEAFVNSQLGYGTAISLVLLAIGILISAIYVRALRTSD